LVHGISLFSFVLYVCNYIITQPGQKFMLNFGVIKLKKQKVSNVARSITA